MKLRVFMLAAVIAATLSFSACGGTNAKTTPVGYTIGGTVSGLPSHLFGFNGLELQDNGGAEMPVGDNGSFTFPTAVASGAAYSVTVTVDPNNPVAQTCVVANGSGTATADVTTVQITCTTSTFTIGGTVSGLTGTVVLQDNGGDNLSVSANGGFTFATPLTSGATYAVTVLTQPSGQTCFVNNGSGNVGKKNVTGVTVTCGAGNGMFTIGGTVTGLTGSGLVLQDNLGDNLTINSNGSFTFATAIAAGSGYNVTILTQPSSPTQNCEVANGGGLVGSTNVTTVVVTCAAIPTYTIGGTIQGLTGTGLVLQDNGGDNLSPTANGNFTFATPVASGSVYKVTVLTEPTNPTQTCTIANGGGTVGTSNVTNVRISCAASVVNEWTWVNGADTVNQSGTYGTLGTAAASNVPGARGGSVSWTDLSGNLWLFGGDGYSATTSGSLNDLWEFNPSTGQSGQWTWMGGSKAINQSGVYGTQGSADTSNIPGARQNAMSWTDPYGNFWLFGGTGYDSTGAEGPLNDLWEYVPSTGEWTWVSGANLINQVSVYGTEGTPDPGNVPGSRFYGQAWADAQGNLWLFGGQVYDAQGGSGNTYGNDLWEFTPTNGEWKWMGGSNLVNQAGVYGTEGTPSALNIPPATYQAVTWTDGAGAFWMFGGGANILWRYSGGEWTWVDGSPITQCGCNPYYGTLGTPGPNNIPGGRILPVQWFDSSGNAWIFGGHGEDSEGNDNSLNDLWRYGSGEWTWMSGSNVVDQKGVYGTLGVEALANIPGARSAAISWVDSSGNFWLFGGGGYDSTGTQGTLNDLWEFKP